MMNCSDNIEVARNETAGAVDKVMQLFRISVDEILTTSTQHHLRGCEECSSGESNGSRNCFCPVFQIAG